jgi:uncharacterized protein YegP (UPF0339 family)
MSDNIIRTSSDAVSEAGRTDWDRVRKLDDAAIDAAIAHDADTYALDIEVLGRADSAYHYEVYRQEDGAYRWRLLSGKSGAVAISPDSFKSKAAALNAIAEVRKALLGGNALAA